MQIRDDQTDVDSLAAQGAEAVAMLCAGSFNKLSERYGYAIAKGREKAAAIQGDLASSLSEVSASSLLRTGSPPQTTVKYFRADSSGLFSVIECLVPTDNGRTILVELAVFASESGKHLSLEQISAAT